MSNELRNRYKLVFFGLIIIAVLMISYVAYTLISRQGKSKVSVYIAPNDSQLVFKKSGQPDIKSGTGDIWLKPGKYTVDVTRDGFKTDTRQVSVAQQSASGNTLLDELVPKTDEAKQWTVDNQDQFTAVEEVSGELYAQSGEDMIKTFPISKDLPIHNPYYTIGAITPDNNTYIVTIDTPSPRYRYAAIQKIRDLGYDPTNYQIEFLQYKSLLGGGQ